MYHMYLLIIIVLKTSATSFSDLLRKIEDQESQLRTQKDYDCGRNNDTKQFRILRDLTKAMKLIEHHSSSVALPSPSKHCPCSA